MKPILFLLLLLSSIILDAQMAEDSVKAVVKQLFDGMRKSDAGMVRSSFADSAILQSIAKNKEGKTIILNENLDEFAKSVSGLKKGAADEQIVFESIKIDGPLAKPG